MTLASVRDSADQVCTYPGMTTTAMPASPVVFLRPGEDAKHRVLGVAENGPRIPGARRRGSAGYYDAHRRGQVSVMRRCHMRIGRVEVDGEGHVFSRLGVDRCDYLVPSRARSMDPRSWRFSWPTPDTTRRGCRQLGSLGERIPPPNVFLNAIAKSYAQGTARQRRRCSDQGGTAWNDNARWRCRRILERRDL